VISRADLLPPLTLAGPDGPWRVPGPGTLASALVFVHPGRCGPCTGYLAELDSIVDDIRSWGTQLLAVAVDGLDDRHRFAVLLDEGGVARRRLGIGVDAAVILADRWGEVMEATTIGPGHEFPLASQLVESAKIVDLSCGECNVPGPEWRAEV